MASASVVIEKEVRNAVEGGVSATAFRQSVSELIRDVRRSLLAVLEFDGRQVSKSDDAQKLFGVDASLSWQLLKLAIEPDLLAASQYLPPRVSVQKFLTSARRKGVAGNVIAAAEAAFDNVEEFINRHAGDRSRFQSMMFSSSRPVATRSSVVEQHRKAAYKSSAFFWGVELETKHVAVAIGPLNGDGNTYDAIFVQSLLNFRCLRPSPGSQLAGFRMWDPTVKVEPLDRDAMDLYGAPVLPQFCRKALPQLRSKTDSSGVFKVSFAGEEIGLNAGADIVFAYALRDVPMDSSGPRHNCLTGHPTKDAFQEIFVHKSHPRMTPMVRSFGHAAFAVDPKVWFDPGNELPCFDEAVFDASVDDARLLGVPRRREILSHCFETRGWNIDDFCVYRVHAAYPVMETATVLALLPRDETSPGT